LFWFFQTSSLILDLPKFFEPAFLEIDAFSKAIPSAPVVLDVLVLVSLTLNPGWVAG
jgi:hypothetical protein